MLERWKSFSLWEKAALIVTLPLTLPMLAMTALAWALVLGIICLLELLFGD